MDEAKVLSSLKRIAVYGPPQGEVHKFLACAFCDMGGAGYSTRGEGFHDDDCAVKDAQVMLSEYRSSESVFLVGFFRFDANGPAYGFKRMHLQGIFKTMEDALEKMSFCDEAGWYEGALIEERHFGNQFCHPVAPPNRKWLLQQRETGEMRETSESPAFSNVLNLIG